MRHDIDVHIVTHPSKDTKLNVEYLCSHLMFHQINTIVTPGIDKNIGQSRYNGFIQSKSKYVTFVDDDDDVDPTAILHCTQLLDEDDSLDGICTNYITNNKANCSPLIDNEIVTLDRVHYIHQLIVLRRTSLEPYLDIMRQCNDLCEFTTWTHMINDKKRIKYVNLIGYHWKPTPKKHNIRIPQIALDAYRLVKQAKIKRIEYAINNRLTSRSSVDM